MNQEQAVKALKERAAALEIVGKCIACGKRFTITLALAKTAEEAGCAISPCCNFPSTVVKATV